MTFSNMKTTIYEHSVVKNYFPYNQVIDERVLLLRTIVLIVWYQHP